MKITIYKTPAITSGSHNLFAVLDAALPKLPDGSVVAVTSKVLALCEGRTVPIEGTNKDQLIAEQAQWYLPREGKYNLAFTVTRGMFIPTAGIDESNGDGRYVLWPADLQKSANNIRRHLMQKHGLQRLGVVITDSTTRPMQWGTTGIAIAYSGFAPLKDYVGKPDIFGRQLQFQKSNIANGLAAAAVTLMGEGSERTPIALIEDVGFVQFRRANPSRQELAALQIAREDDIYWPLLKRAPWVKGTAE